MARFFRRQWGWLNLGVQPSPLPIADPGDATMDHDPLWAGALSLVLLHEETGCPHSALHAARLLERISELPEIDGSTRDLTGRRSHDTSHARSQPRRSRQASHPRCHASPIPMPTRFPAPQRPATAFPAQASETPYHVAGGAIRLSLSSDLQGPAGEEASPRKGSRRQRLWELGHKCHCPIVGVCFSVEELRKRPFVTRKFI